MENTGTEIAKPFLRWAGGKVWLVKKLNEIIPENFNNYYELFLGGGSFFFHLASRNLLKRKIILNDINLDLISCYYQIKFNLKEVKKYLNSFKNEHDFYYKLRGSKFKNQAKEAAKFIYLNRTSYNGIYRVNKNGIYNVPFGFKKYEQLFDFDNLLKVNNVLENVELYNWDFYDFLKGIKKNDLIFLDPPYTVAHENNGFVKYNQKIFSWEDQKRLASFINEIRKIGAYYILTNAAHEKIDELFGSFGNRMVFPRASLIGGKNAKRKTIYEYVYTNNFKYTLR